MSNKCPVDITQIVYESLNDETRLKYDFLYTAFYGSKNALATLTHNLIGKECSWDIQIGESEERKEYLEFERGQREYEKALDFTDIMVWFASGLQTNGEQFLNDCASSYSYDGHCDYTDDIDSVTKEFINLLSKERNGVPVLQCISDKPDLVRNVLSNIFKTHINHDELAVKNFYDSIMIEGDSILNSDGCIPQNNSGLLQQFTKTDALDEIPHAPDDPSI